MPFFWNDKTYWKRYKESANITLKLFLPMMIICFVFWFILLREKEEILAISFLAFFSAGSIFTFISIFKQFPNQKIPDTYPQWGRNLMYIGQFLIVILGFYILIVGILQHHYTFFESLVCCDWIKNFKL